MEQLKLIELKNISKAYDGDMVLENLNLYILKNEFITLLRSARLPKKAPR